MTRTDFIIECSMRLFAMDTVVTERECIECAETLADELEAKGYINK